MLIDVDTGYYITLNRDPYILRAKSFEPTFEKFYGFDKLYAGRHCHKWALGDKCTDKLKFVYANSYSHYLLLKHLGSISWKSRFMFIFEDDAVLFPDWKKKWNESVPDIPYDAELVYLHHHPAHERKFGSHIKTLLNIHVGTPLGPYSTTSYAITKQFVHKILDYVSEHGIYRSYDSMLNSERETFNIYSLVNSICYENKEEYKSERLNNT